MTLTGRTALIFGGGSLDGKLTNGLAAAQAYAGAGAEVVIVDLQGQAAQDSREAILRALPDARVTALQGDVTDTDSVRTCVAEVLRTSGRIDILHNNVGVAVMGGPLDLEVADWDRALRLNLTSAFVTVKHVLPVMLRQGSGSIINIASIGGMRHVGYDYPAYAAAKAGLIQFTAHLAIQHGRDGIRANALSPGFIATPMMHQQITGSHSTAEEMIAARDALSPTGAMGSPEDVGAAALFLASDAARYVNGVCLPVDGGFLHQGVPGTS
ncbi:SDR family oxidoreductase [Nesterenkonia sp. CL21]|uniref:SDR family NAD(P)-dependent oxidoreductase n=1 Tax=Nesterenkonia sp. CL21 TaxID=3064894 RepID=UPI002878BE7B|nr:SDR family oxidoreductase [Nesterenkonia sp. CL21]MDS2173738.1 SDR family oxidoreductase [Nesterenkonia sp. CL21]